MKINGAPSWASLTRIGSVVAAVGLIIVGSFATFITRSEYAEHIKWGEQWRTEVLRRLDSIDNEIRSLSRQRAFRPEHRRPLEPPKPIESIDGQV